jgi:hypothetical protein
MHQRRCHRMGCTTAKASRHRSVTGIASSTVSSAFLSQSHAPSFDDIYMAPCSVFFPSSHLPLCPPFRLLPACVVRRNDPTVTGDMEGKHLAIWTSTPELLRTCPYRVLHSSPLHADHGCLPGTRSGREMAPKRQSPGPRRSLAGLWGAGKSTSGLPSFRPGSTDSTRAQHVQHAPTTQAFRRQYWTSAFW